MRIVTAKQLKQKTGEIIKMVRAGERFTLTYRGKPVAIIQPVSEHSREMQSRSFDEAWRDIETTLAESKPWFSDWREATGWMRDRN